MFFLFTIDLYDRERMQPLCFHIAHSLTIHDSVDICFSDQMVSILLFSEDDRDVSSLQNSDHIAPLHVLRCQSQVAFARENKLAMEESRMRASEASVAFLRDCLRDTALVKLSRADPLSKVDSSPLRICDKCAQKNLLGS